MSFIGTLDEARNADFPALQEFVKGGRGVLEGDADDLVEEGVN
jgi:hypothetical protein